MGLFLFSFVISIVFAGILWLIIGDRLPINKEDKWDTRMNLLAYVILLFVVAYVVMFTLDF